MAFRKGKPQTEAAKNKEISKQLFAQFLEMKKLTEDQVSTVLNMIEQRLQLAQKLKADNKEEAAIKVMREGAMNNNQLETLKHMMQDLDALINRVIELEDMNNFKKAIVVGGKGLELILDE
ncbi:MAG: hypothetical protein EZS28_039200, partial [Streblomastix strix]